MKKMSTILRSLLLVVLLGGLGIVTQPASAQQTVTLSGRVTDTAGNAVSGATVNLEDPGWVGQETDANGNYRLSVPPGTYRLRVRPRHGPLISQKIERLRLSTNTTRNFVLEEGVTLSGQVTANGQPVPHPWLWVVNNEGQEVSFNSANQSGHYSLGVPAGTYEVNVYSEDFLGTTVEGVSITQATVLNITLEAGVLLEGKVVDDAGQPVSNAQVCAHRSTEAWWEGFCAHTEPTGSFQLRATPDAGYVVTVRPVAPLHPTRHRLEVSEKGVSDLVLTVSRDPTPFVPDDPPKAALISISPPTADGEVTLTGAAGSVTPESAIVAVTLDTGHITTAQATASGSFTATLFAPAGTSILVKADPFGTNVTRFVNSERFVNGDLDDNPTSNLSALPGTILRVADPPGTGIPISGAGKVEFERLPAWTFHGSINTDTFTPGDTLRVRGTVRVDSPALQSADALQVETQLVLERADGPSLLHGTSGAATTFLTPTGLPLERHGHWWATGFNQYRELPLVKAAATQAEARLDLTITLPPDMPAGYYRPFLNFYFPDMPRENPSSRQFLVPTEHDTGTLVLPTIKVGSPIPPRLDWVLFMDTLSNGSRGVLAREDAARFGIAQRILTSSETFVIPRLGAADNPLTYRLEPFVPTVSLANSSGGNPPNAPRISFRFPSGSLTVRIRQPGGTERVLGPAPFVQSRLKSLVNEEGNGPLDGGGGHLREVYQLTTLDPRFEVAFTQDGLHVITVEGTIDDIYGTYLDGRRHLRQSMLVGCWPWIRRYYLGRTFEVGDGFNPGLVVSPPVTAEVEVRLQHHPSLGHQSD